MFRKIIVGVVIALLFLVAVAPFAGAAAWWLDMLNHFRVQLAIATFVVVFGWFAVSRKRWILIGLFAAVLHLLPTLPATVGRPGNDGVRVAHANVGGWSSADRYAWVASLDDVDAVFLLEVKVGEPIATEPPPGWQFALQYPTHDSRGIVALVPAGAPVDAALVDFAVPHTTRRMAMLTIGNWKVLQIHLARPGSAAGFEEQVRMTAAVAGWVKQQYGPVAVLGDFNATPWSAAVAPLRDAGLKPAASALTGTWPATLPPFARVTIDHALCTSGASMKVGPDHGGDHRPIVVSLPRVPINLPPVTGSPPLSPPGR